jgi:AraC-like DNA-binding protein
MSTAASRTLAHWRIEPGVDVFDILTKAEPGTLHCHPTYNFGCVLDGRAQLELGGRSYAQPEGTVVLLNAFEAHASTWLADESRYFVVYVGEEAWAKLLEGIGAPHTTRFSHPIVRDDILFYALKGLWSELSKRPESIGFDDVFHVLRTTIARGWTLSSSHGAPEISTDQAILQSLSPGSTPDAEGQNRVEDVAAALGLTRFQLSRLCQANHGMQPRRLRLQLMVAQAQVEISKGASLTEAAHLAGFSDQSHMTREFRRTVGMTPREYQAVLIPG